jgi:hypothetical protein
VEAKKRLNALHNAVHTGEHVDPDHITLATWAEHWLKLGAPGQRRQEVGARSLERYEQNITDSCPARVGAVSLAAIAIDKH